jgi:hypothetical protein
MFGQRRRAHVTIARLMHILMLSARDAAPRERVHVLADALARAGHSVDLIASEQPGLNVASSVPGLRIATVPEYPPLVPATDRLAWALQLNAGLLERSTQLSESARYDVVHAHDWETAWAAAATKNLLELPLVSTLHGVEAGDDEESKLISQAEWWLTYESRRTIVPIDLLRRQIEDAFELPVDKQAVISDDLLPAEQAAHTATVYEEAIADDRERRSRGEVRPSLRVILGRAHKP